MAEVTPENILAASAAEVAEAMQEDVQSADDVAQTADDVPTAETNGDAGDAASDGTNVTETTVAANGNSAAPLATTTAVAAAAPANGAATAAAAATPPRSFNFKWLLSAEKNRQHFADELFNTTFSQESVEKVVEELKTVTANKIANSHRLCEDDHIYSVQITAHGSLRIPTHLMRM